MLKIKDEVDLKELEKFGFKRIRDTYHKPISNDLSDDFRINIVVNPLYDTKGYYGSREIIIEVYNLSEIVDFDIAIELDDVFDLIQAGIVEKC